MHAEPPVAEDYSDPDVVWRLVTDLASADDYLAEYAALTPEAQDAVLKAMTATGQYVVESSPLADHVDCDTQLVEVHKYNDHGWTMATYESSTYWCWDGDEILGVPIFRTDGHIAWWARQFWKYNGNWYKEEDMDYEDRWWHADRASGHFKECVPLPLPGRITVWLCYDSPSFVPVINKWQYANGGRRYESED